MLPLSRGDFVSPSARTMYALHVRAGQNRLTASSSPSTALEIPEKHQSSLSRRRLGDIAPCRRCTRDSDFQTRFSLASVDAKEQLVELEVWRIGVSSRQGAGSRSMPTFGITLIPERVARHDAEGGMKPACSFIPLIAVLFATLPPFPVLQGSGSGKPTPNVNGTAGLTFFNLGFTHRLRPPREPCFMKNEVAHWSIMKGD